MSMDPAEAALEEAYAQLAKELYGEHKEQAIEEFINERLKSYYIDNPGVMCPALDAIQEGKRLQGNGHHSAALVFFVSAIEILLKATLLRPILYGLIHNESLAEIFVQQTLNGIGFKRYKNLIAGLYQTLTYNDLGSVFREGAKKDVLSECCDCQDIRNGIVHCGDKCNSKQAENCGTIAAAVVEDIVRPVLNAIGLGVNEKGEIITT